MKRKLWLWILIALACSAIVSVVSWLTDVSIASIFGWGISGILFVVFIIVVGGLFIFPIAYIFKFLLESLIANREMLYITLGSLGLCAILVGLILFTRGWYEWSFPVIIVGYSLGCLAGAEFQKNYDLQSKLREAKTEAYQIIGRGRINDPKQFKEVLSALEEYGGRETRDLVNDLYELKQKAAKES